MTDHTYQTTKALCSFGETRPRQRVQADRFILFFSTAFKALGRRARASDSRHAETFSTVARRSRVLFTFPVRRKKNTDIKSPHLRSLSAPLEPPSSPSSFSRKSRLHFKRLAFGSLFLFLLDAIKSADLGNLSSTFSFLFSREKLKAIDNNYIDV